MHVCVRTRARVCVFSRMDKLITSSLNVFFLLSDISQFKEYFLKIIRTNYFNLLTTKG